MKKIINICILLVVGVTVALNSQYVKGDSYQDEISKKIIRFHVLANSDSTQDQALKIKVKNEIIKYISPKLEDCKDINESRKILLENDKEIKRIATETIKNNGYNYKVATNLSKENFPIKSYGDITLPQGQYEAYRIIIGSGRGQNWWCVMFPPLCFIDITKGEISREKTIDKMDDVLTKEEMNSITQEKDNNSKEKDKKETDSVKEIQVRFKIVDIIQDIFK